jgi:hypothetical protein
MNSNLMIFKFIPVRIRRILPNFNKMRRLLFFICSQITHERAFLLFPLSGTVVNVRIESSMSGDSCLEFFKFSSALQKASVFVSDLELSDQSSGVFLF